MSRVLSRCRGEILRLRCATKTASILGGSNNPHFQQQRHVGAGPKPGYIILLPEVPPDTPETTALMNVKETPRFDTLGKENYITAVGKSALELESCIWRIEDKLKDPQFQRTYENILEPLEVPSATFDYVWGVLKTLNLVKNDYFPTEGYNRIHDRARQARSKKYVSIPIYFACKEMKADSHNLNEPQQRVLDKFLLEGRLSGVELTGNASLQMSQILQKIAEEKAKFKENVDIATNGFRHLIVEPKYVGDMPTHLLKHLAKDKSQPNKAPWVVRLSSPTYKAFLEYCPEAGIRWNAWNAYNTRASGYSDKNVNNSIHIEELRSKRQEQAQLLGFENYVELSMNTKMAGTEDNVQTMLATLFSHAQPKQTEEFEELKSFAASRGFEGILRPWDVDFWRRRQRSALFNVDDDAISEFFPFPEVWKNLCAFAEDIFNIKLKKVEIPVWHEDASYYEIFDKTSNRKLGGFYLDPYSRPKQKLGRHAVLGNKTLCGIPDMSPLSTLVFNFLPPMYGKPSLLSFDDVNVLFGKFGQILQQLLTTVPYHEVSGTNNIEWDAIFVTEKFMTMWLGNKAVVKEMSSHFENGSKMTDDMIRNLLRSRKHMAAMDLCHELYLSALDIDLYKRKDFWMDIMKSLWPVYHAPLQLDKRDSHVCTMVDIFSGDFAAAYYCKLWSQMLAADMYQQFVEKGQGRDAWRIRGQRFRESFLAMGGGYHPNKIFRQFSGRDPSLDAILWTLGLKAMTIAEPDPVSNPNIEEPPSPEAVKLTN